MDNQEKFNWVKILGEKLLNVYPNKDFVVEICKALDSNEEFSAVNQQLDENPDMVVNDIYELVASVTGGRFAKELPEIRMAEKKYLDDSSEENLRELLSMLENITLYMPFDWDLTEEEREAFTSAEIGDDVHIETPLQPRLFVDEEEGYIVFPLFTSEEEIPRIISSEYAIQTVPFGAIVNTMKNSIKDLERDFVIGIDGFSKYGVIITEEMV